MPGIYAPDGSQNVTVTSQTAPTGTSNVAVTNSAAISQVAVTQSYTPIPAFSGTVDATSCPVVLANNANVNYREIVNNGAVDVELWFGARPAAGDVNQNPRRGLVLPANGGGRMWDSKVPTGTLYATCSAAGVVVTLQGV